MQQVKGIKYILNNEEVNRETFFSGRKDNDVIVVDLTSPYVETVSYVDFNPTEEKKTKGLSTRLKANTERKSGVKETQTVKKAPIFTYCKQMKNAIEQLAFRTQYGHEKYKEFDADYQNFARVENGDEEYGNALFRHALEIGEDTELEHYVASAWDAVARLEIYLRNKHEKTSTNVIQ